MKEKIRSYLKKSSAEAAERKRKYTALKNSDGVKIRMQYFNAPIFAVIALIVFMLFIGGAVAIKNKESIFSHDMITSFGGLFILTAPFIILSAINRFFFGRVVCVINDEGIRLIDEPQIIKWGEIVKVSYTPAGVIGHRLYFSEADIHVRIKCSELTRTLTLPHLPLYGIRLMKRHMPEAKFSLISVWFLAALPFALSLIISLIILLGR